MNAFIKYLSILIFLLGVMPSRASAQVRVIAQVDTSKDIYIGENFLYRIIIDGDDKPGQVDLTPLRSYNPQSAGGGNASQTSTTIINRKVTTNVIKRYIMNYLLSADKPGQIVLSPVTVTIGGRQYNTNPVQVNVLKPGTTDRLDLEVTLSEQKCYVGQPILMTVKFYISAEVGDFQFNVPTFSSDAFYIEDPDVADLQARLYRLHTGITVLVSQHQVVHNGRDSILLSFSKVLIPKQSGQIEIEPVSVSADVAVGRERSRDTFFDDFSLFGSRKTYKRFMVNSAPLKLTVLPLPEQNRPAQFYGLVGRYTISASATPTKVNVGDPITLTIKIGGSKYLKPVQWPELEQIPGLVSNFKVPSQKASPTIEDGHKVFTQTIRADNDKVAEIPPIPLAFFDSNKGRYVLAETEPIRLEVAPTKVLTNADLEGRDFAPMNKEVEAIKKGLSANYEGLDVLTNQAFSPLTAIVSPGYMVLWAGPLAGLILSSLFKLFTHTTPEKIAARRRRQAPSKAIRQLKKITSDTSQQRYELLASAMKQYIGERFDKKVGSLTADDCREVIITSTQDMQAAERYRDIITQCEAARYAPAEAEVDAVQAKKAIELIRTIEKKSKK